MELKQVFPIFDRLEEADQNTLSASARALHFKRGDMIYAGDKCMGLLLICFVLPAVLTLVFAYPMRRNGLIKENDLKLDL